MGKVIVNLLVSAVALVFVYFAALFASFAWTDAFVSGRTFTVYLGFIDASMLWVWSFFFLFFFGVGIGLPALLRTHRPVLWAACFGGAFSLCRLIASSYQFLDPDPILYVSIAGEYVMPVLGCVAGALVGRRLRGVHGSGQGWR